MGTAGDSVGDLGQIGVHRLRLGVLILDGAGWHDAKGLAVPDTITLLPLPPYAPELNPVENVWADLRANKRAITVFDSSDDIVTACGSAWTFFATNPKTIASITSRTWAAVS